MEWECIKWEDIGVFVRIAVDGTSAIEYEVYDWGGQESDGTWLFQLKRPSEDSFNLTSLVDKAQPFMAGTIKWDGCSHNNFGEDGYIHGCGLSDITKISDVFQRLWDVAMTRLPNMKDFAL